MASTEKAPDSALSTASAAPPDPAEYEAALERVAIVDRSERGKLALDGPDAAEFLNGQVSNDVAALEPGGGCYAALLTPKGRMLADLRVLRPAPPFSGLWLDTERIALQALFDALRSHLIGYSVQLHKHTLEYGLLSLVGPDARAVLGDLAPRTDDEHASVAGSIAGAEVLAAATDAGVDVLCRSDALAGVSAQLQRAGARSVSEAVTECLRVERGRPRYGIDMDDTTMPQEAGIHERAVSYSKGCYVGQETVARLYWKGKPNRQLRGLKLARPAPSGTELRDGEQPVGRLGSVAVSPRFGPIGLALLRREVAVGSALSAGAGAEAAEVVALPFSR